MRKVICNRCGADISNQDEVGYIAMNHREIKSGFLPDNNVHEDKDFCETCMAEIEEFVNLTVKRKKSRSNVVKNKEIDAGRVMALYDAGWTYIAIANDMSVTIRSVQEIVEKEKNKKNELAEELGWIE